MRFNLFTTLCAFSAPAQLAIAADPVRPPSPPDPFTNKQVVTLTSAYGAAACGVGAIICSNTGQPAASIGLQVAVVCCGLAATVSAAYDEKQWNASVKKYGDKAKATCRKTKEGVVVCGEWVADMVGGAWQVVRRAATAERHFVPRKRARLARSVDGFKTRGGRKIRRHSRGREIRERVPLRF